MKNSVYVSCEIYTLHSLKKNLYSYSSFNFCIYMYIYIVLDCLISSPLVSRIIIPSDCLARSHRHYQTLIAKKGLDFTCTRIKNDWPIHCQAERHANIVGRTQFSVLSPALFNLSTNPSLLNCFLRSDSAHPTHKSYEPFTTELFPTI